MFRKLPSKAYFLMASGSVTATRDYQLRASKPKMGDQIMEDGVWTAANSLHYSYGMVTDLTCANLVYTCQKSQLTGCGFFLWDDEAKFRSTTAVLSNSRSEPRPMPHSPQSPQSPQTPTKPHTPRVLTTPSKILGTENGFQVALGDSASDSPSKETGISQSLANSTLSSDQLSDDDDEFYDWPASEGEDLSKAAESTLKNPMPPPETPRKAIKLDPFSTPGKRRYDEMIQEEIPPWPTPSTSTKDDDIFTTPPKISRGTSLFAQSGLLSPMNSPTPQRFRDLSGQEPELTQEILQALQSYQIVISPEVQSTIKSIGSKHSLFTHGVIKGRDVSRSLLRKKNEQILELEGKLAALQQEREVDKAAIRQLTEKVEMRSENVT